MFFLNFYLCFYFIPLIVSHCLQCFLIVFVHLKPTVPASLLGLPISLLRKAHPAASKDFLSLSPSSRSFLSPLMLIPSVPSCSICHLPLTSPLALDSKSLAKAVRQLSSHQHTVVYLNSWSNFNPSFSPGSHDFYPTVPLPASSSARLQPQQTASPPLHFHVFLSVFSLGAPNISLCLQTESHLLGL